MRHLKFWIASVIVGCGAGWVLGVVWQRVRPKTIHEQVAERIEELKSSDWETRLAAVDALQKIGREGGAAVPALIKALKDNRGDISSHAVFALGSLGPAAAPAAPAIAEHLRDHNAWFPPEADAVLVELGPDAYLAAPRLTEMLKDRDGAVRQLAAHSLSRIGFAAAPAAPALAEALTDSSSEVRINADSALISIAYSIRDNLYISSSLEVKKAAAQWLKIRLRPDRTPGKETPDVNFNAETLAAARFLGKAIQKELRPH